MRSKELWLVPENHATVKLDWNRFSWNELKEKAELNCEIHNSWRTCWKSQVSFCHQSSPVRKDTVRKLPVVVNTEDHSIRVLSERSVNDRGNLCPLWLVILISVSHSVWDTLELWYSWPWAVVNYTLLALLTWNGLEHLLRKGGYVFILTDLKKWCFVFHSWY